MIWAIVPAAGRGARFGGGTPKQYLRAGGRPLIAHALEPLLANPDVVGVIVALAPGDVHWPQMELCTPKPVRSCIGGATRAESVRAALAALPPSDDSLVLVHDAARPNLHASDLQQLIDAARACDEGAILASPVRDTLKRVDGDAGDARIVATAPREGLWRALTPQAFRREVLARALDAAHSAGLQATDEAMAVEQLGLHPRVVAGRDDNLKVTTRADLALFEALLAARQ